MADLDVREPKVVEQARDESGIARAELEVDCVAAVPNRAVEKLDLAVMAASWCHERNASRPPSGF
jgi:hypothetical protein